MTLRRLPATLLIVAALLAGCTGEPADETTADGGTDDGGLTGQVTVTDPNGTGEENETGDANETGSGNGTRASQP